jgi:hypothetical protein
MGRTDYVPKRFADFDAFLQVIVEYVLAKTAGNTNIWPHISEAAVNKLNELWLKWHTAYEKTLAPHSSVETRAKNDARKEAESYLRSFVAQYLMFPPVTDEDRAAMHLRNRDKERTPVPAPSTRALLSEIKPLGGFRVEVRFYDEAKPRSRAIPYGYNGCLLCYALGDEKVSDYTALIRTQLMSRTPWTLTFPPESEGKFLSCTTRWQSDKTILGPWGEIMHVVIA